MGPWLRVSSERLEKPGIEPTTPGLEGEQLNHYATEAIEGADQLPCYHAADMSFCFRIGKQQVF